MGPGARQDKTKTQINLSSWSSQFCTASQSPPNTPTCPLNREPTPSATKFKASFHYSRACLGQLSGLLYCNYHKRNCHIPCCITILLQCSSTILLCQHGVLFLFFHWWLPEGHQGWAFLYQYWCQSSPNLLTHILHQNVLGWKPLLQHLPRLNVPTKPEVLLFLAHHSL